MKQVKILQQMSQNMSYLGLHLEWVNLYHYLKFNVHSRNVKQDWDRH